MQTRAERALPAPEGLLAACAPSRLVARLLPRAIQPSTRITRPFPPCAAPRSQVRPRFARMVELRARALRSSASAHAFTGGACVQRGLGRKKAEPCNSGLIVGRCATACVQCMRGRMSVCSLCAPICAPRARAAHAHLLCFGLSQCRCDGLRGRCTGLCCYCVAPCAMM